MPLYEYECEKCGHHFERIQKFSDDLVSTCPACGGKVKKLLSSPAIQFKGTGWYITDYARKPSGGQPATSDSDDKAASGKGKSESKSGEKTSDSKSEKTTKPDSSSSAAK